MARVSLSTAVDEQVTEQHRPISKICDWIGKFNYFIKYRVPILPQSILHSRQVRSIDFCYAGEGVEAVYNRKPLNRDCIHVAQQKWTKFKIVIIVLIIFILYQ